MVSVAALTVGALALYLSGPADAAVGQKVNVVELVTNSKGAPLVDPLLTNPWGLAASPTGPLWVADNGSGYATVYAGGVGANPATKANLNVWVDGGSPTGQVFNDSTTFIIPGKGPTPASKAVFIFSSESGNITAWSPTSFPHNHAVVVASVPGAVYKGLAILHFGSTALLLATNFHTGQIDVFDGQFKPRPQYSKLFVDPKLPKGYAPFGIATAPGGRGVYVTYAKTTPGSNDEVDGPGLGIVDFFDGLKKPVRIASHGTLNAPWGLAIAPAAWGKLAGALLVGNFGDGRIGAYRDGTFLGLLRDGHGVIKIDGLWGLLPGTAAAGGTDAVWFSAGPNEEADGLVGKLVPMK